MMGPDVIEAHGRRMRKTVERLRQSYGGSHPALKEVFSLADDICELVIALAENQKEWLAKQQAEAPRGDPQ